MRIIIKLESLEEGAIAFPEMHFKSVKEAKQYLDEEVSEILHD